MATGFCFLWRSSAEASDHIWPILEKETKTLRDSRRGSDVFRFAIPAKAVWHMSLNKIGKVSKPNTKNKYNDILHVS